MPNIRGGKLYKKTKTNRDRRCPTRVVETVDVELGEGFYATIIKRLGGKPAQFEATLSNGIIDTIILRGRLHKKVWVNPGMIVLINNAKEIIKIIKDSDNDARNANKMMEKIENNKTIFSSFFANESSDSDDSENCDDRDDSGDSDDNCDNDIRALLHGNIRNKKNDDVTESEESEESDESDENEESEESDESCDDCSEERDRVNYCENHKNNTKHKIQIKKKQIYSDGTININGI